LKTQADAREAGEIEIVERASSSLIALEVVIPRLALRFPAGPTDAAITLDGVPVIATPEGIEVDPGKHRIVVTAEGHRPFELSFEVSQRQHKEILVELKREPDAAATRVAEPPLGPAPDRSSPSRFGPPLPVWILAGAGATATAAGLIVRFKGQSDYDAVSADCPDNHCTSPEAMTSGNAARRRMLVGSVIAGVGSLTIVSAGVWWAWSASSSRRENRSATLSARVYPSADGCSLLFDGSF
jgi:PEGA domain